MNKDTPDKLEVEPRHWFLPTLLAITALLVLGALAYGVDYSGRSSFCGGCHEMEEYLHTRKSSTHPKVSCVACHQGPGISGFFELRANLIKDYGLTRLYFRRHRPTLASSVNNDSCLSCHKKIENKTITTASNIRVRHKELIEENLGCGRCHADVGHDSNAATVPIHDYCFMCHTSEASGEGCRLCHQADIAYGGEDQIENFGKANIASINDCTTCHSKPSCDSCHIKRRKLIEY